MLPVESFTDEQKRAIEELKERIIYDLTPRLLQDETLFYRFLKARDFNVNKAEDMLRKHLIVRKMLGEDDILQNYTPSEHIKKYLPNSFMGFDKTGSVVRYIDVGGVDAKGIVHLFDLRQIILYATHYIEKDIDRMAEQTKLGKPAWQTVLILNMENLNLFTVTYKKGIEWAIEGAKIYQDNQPERIKSIYIINAAFYFNIGFSILKSVLNEGVLKKMRTFTRTGWQEALLEIIDADTLPAFLGGNRTDPDGNPRCNSFIVHGRKIPEELYLTKQKSTMSKENGAKKLTVSPFSSSEILIYVSELGTWIEWEFETKNRDIAFAFYYRDDSVENLQTKELIPKQRIDTMLASETGLYKCDKKGTYIIMFDNTYSWIHSKEIYYKIRLIKPKEDILFIN